ncbi:hypothetical protein ABT084_11315 [Streptomyces sp. NPDC002138]|uniref:hypothetical protein n=1 Tax=Streptomyces sp. NPDC002138 TaxID=3154410 RepID=UPI00332257D9
MALGPGQAFELRPPPFGRGVGVVLFLPSAAEPPELRIHHGRRTGTSVVPTERFESVLPSGNQAVVFPAYLTVASTPVEGRSRSFQQRQLAVIGHLGDAP